MKILSRVAAATLLFLAISPASRGQLLNDIIDVPIVLEERVNPEGNTFLSEGKELGFTGVAIQGFSSDSVLSGKVRYRYLQRDWSEWQDLYVINSTTDASFLAADRGTFATQFELRFSGEVDLTSYGAFHDHPEGPRTNQRGRIFQHETLVDPPLIRTREDWGANPYEGTLRRLGGGPNAPLVIFHPAGGLSARNLEEGIGQVRALQDFYQNGLGMNDIGYHFILDQAGNVYQGRPFWAHHEEGIELALGQHAGMDVGNVGVGILGCNQFQEERDCLDALAPAARDSLAALSAYLLAGEQWTQLHLMRRQVYGHAACSGSEDANDWTYDPWPYLVDEVASLIADSFGQPASDKIGFLDAFPNPLGRGQIFRLRYVVPSEAHVRVEIFDALGRMKDVLIDEIQPAQLHLFETVLNPDQFGAGLYVLRLTVKGISGEPGFTDTLKVISSG